ncbi:hypothetical protein STRAU_2062 [Streptomyces aurantiacus JA 4570]|uniref:Uncharacterized protein n=1 Tax=Streptomyces aurantiacus JA 4570 TaxID=1286094 RepID=S4ATY4_9ACTN|nr:hypothetical protein STRAU_2062 [Streptomyces aurantiacus JA 4570]
MPYLRRRRRRSVLACTRPPRAAILTRIGQEWLSVLAFSCLHPTKSASQKRQTPGATPRTALG